jgi:hypothetical protein
MRLILDKHNFLVLRGITEVLLKFAPRPVQLIPKLMHIGISPELL